jgi:hypothetical protein
MSIARLLSVCAVLCAAVAAQTQFAVATYNVSGNYGLIQITATGVVSNQGNSGTHNSSNPSSWGIDDLTWNAARGKYKITDGDTGVHLGWLKIKEVSPDGRTYTCDLEDPQENDLGNETWTKS